MDLVLILQTTRLSIFSSVDSAVQPQHAKRVMKWLSKLSSSSVTEAQGEKIDKMAMCIFVNVSLAVAGFIHIIVPLNSMLRGPSKHGFEGIVLF